MKMKKITGLLVLLSLMGFAVSVFAQADLDVFPIGTTKMVYKVITEEMDEPQTLELVVVSRESGRYTLRMITEASGTEDQLAGFGFIFGATSVASGGGHDVSYSSLQALMDQRKRLEEGQEYLLPGGGAFTDIVGVTIAGVWCLEGSFVDPDEPETRMTVTFALSHPVYISPRIRAEELVDGEWVEIFVIELIEYTVTEGKG